MECFVQETIQLRVASDFKSLKVGFSCLDFWIEFIGRYHFGWDVGGNKEATEQFQYRRGICLW